MTEIKFTGRGPKRDPATVTGLPKKTVDPEVLEKRARAFEKVLQKNIEQDTQLTYGASVSRSMLIQDWRKEYGN